MIFLRPFSRQFPFDEVASEIVSRLECRAWKHDCMKITFREYGGRYKYVERIESVEPDVWSICFGRAQCVAPDQTGYRKFNDVAAVEALHIPMKKITVYPDESGPRFVVYVGKDWSSDKATFFKSSCLNSKINAKPRTHLVYTGGCRCGGGVGASFDAISLIAGLTGSVLINSLPHKHSNCRPPLLVHDSDIGRNYSPEGDEPTEYNTADVLHEFTQYLREHVLARL